jgi:AAA domain
MTLHQHINSHDDIAWGTGRAADAPISEGGEPNPLKDDPVDEFETTAAPLIPNKVDIAAHLYALFPPAFVQTYPDAWFKIAFGRPDGKPDAAENFSVFDLETAVEFAERKNAAGCNVYVGPALRQGTRPDGGRSSGSHVLTSSHAWAEFDKPGDEARITVLLKEKNLTPAMTVVTGHTPNLRAHIYFRLNSGVVPDQLRVANTSLKKLLGTDAVQNPDRIMRLAGTINYPSPDKRGRGYVTEMVTLHQNPDKREYSLDELIGVAPGAARGPGYGETEDKPASTVESFFKDVNDLALNRLSHWVKPLFGNAVKFHASTGCWRTEPDSNKTLAGRAHLEEVIQISQRGVWDYGFEKPSDPITLVIDYGPRKSSILPTTAADAAHWLCERMGIAPEALGWGTRERRSADDPEYAEGGYDFNSAPGQGNSSDNQGAGTGTNDSQAGSNPLIMHATPYVFTDPTTIQRRQWLYGKLLLRKFVTGTISPGGIGKSSLVTAEALAMVSGKDLLDISPPAPLRVWLWNLEDPLEETARKIQAAALQYELEPDDLGDRLMVDSGREQRMVIATTSRNGAVIVGPVVESIVAEIVKHKIDVIIIDPFVSCHEVAENDNGAMDMVVKEWGRVAERGNCAVHLVHHTRKMGGTGGESEVTADSSRGGSSQTDGWRAVRTINRMTKEHANNLGIENPWLYFRTINGKPNLEPPADESDWYKLVSVDLGNGALGPGFPGGDSIGVVTKWDPPEALAGMTAADFQKVAIVIRGGKWRFDPQAKDWVGKAVAQALGFRDPATDKPTKGKIKRILGAYYAAKSLVVVDGVDEKRKVKQFVEVAEED